jgi:competence protein ComEA
MSKREILVLVILIAVLIALNVVNYAKRERLKANTLVVVEEIAVKIPINSAQTDELDVLPGIGPALAGRIVAYRKEHGPFKTVEDIKKVKGIGNKLFEKMLPFIEL